MFVDSHCHLEGEKFDADRADALQRAADLGIEAVLAIGNGTGPASYDCGIRLAETFSTAAATKIYTSVGIHPHEAKVATAEAYGELERLARHPAVIAWGEIGLDFWYEFSPRDLQRAVFVRQMELARAAQKPIVIHCRGSKTDPEDAWNDVLRLLKLNWAGSGLGGILHCFTGEQKHWQAALDLGFMISIAGNVTFPKAELIRNAAREVPLGKLLIETDSPYLAPVPHRGSRNEPAFVRDVAHHVARLRQMTKEEIGAVTSENFYCFFKLERRSA